MGVEELEVVGERECPSEVKNLAQYLVKSYLDVTAGDRGKPIFLQGGTPEFNHFLYGEVTRLLSERRSPVPVFSETPVGPVRSSR